jgi:hypothetical protein
MASPFCTICGALRDKGEYLACEVFPLGIPKLIYPCGCDAYGVREGFKPRRGFEEIARRWNEIDKESRRDAQVTVRWTAGSPSGVAETRRPSAFSCGRHGIQGKCGHGVDLPAA